MKARVIVTLLVKRDNKILLGQKVKDVGPYPNTWHLQGGELMFARSAKCNYFSLRNYKNYFAEARASLNASKDWAPTSWTVLT